ncbi:hypothetical protein V8C35DRAFT_291126 [Trichoderma chlorosporum]
MRLLQLFSHLPYLFLLTLLLFSFVLYCGATTYSSPTFFFFLWKHRHFQPRSVMMIRRYKPPRSLRSPEPSRTQSAGLEQSFKPALFRTPGKEPAQPNPIGYSKCKPRILESSPFHMTRGSSLASAVVGKPR